MHSVAADVCVCSVSVDVCVCVCVVWVSVGSSGIRRADIRAWGVEWQGKTARTSVRWHT